MNINMNPDQVYLHEDGTIKKPADSSIVRDRVKIRSELENERQKIVDKLPHTD